MQLRAPRSALRDTAPATPLGKSLSTSCTLGTARVAVRRSALPPACSGSACDSTATERGLTSGAQVACRRKRCIQTQLRRPHAGARTSLPAMAPGTGEAAARAHSAAARGPVRVSKAGKEAPVGQGLACAALAAWAHLGSAAPRAELNTDRSAPESSRRGTAVGTSRCCALTVLDLPDTLYDKL